MVSPYLYVGYSCNNNCIFCSEADSNETIKPFNKLKEEILEIRKKYDFINIMGREPTLRPDIIKIIKFAKTMKFNQVSLTTNGRMLAYKKFCDKFIETGIDQTVISLNAHEAELHDYQTIVNGSFNQTINGLKNILESKNKLKSIIVNIPVNQKNYESLPQIVDFVRDLGVKEINLLNVAPLSKRSKTREIIAKLSDVVPYLIEIIKQYKKTDLKILFVEFPPCVIPKDYKKYFFPCLEENTCKIKLDLCGTCEYDKICTGVLQDYIDIYGEGEFLK